MGTQYLILNHDKREFIDANSLGWDSKRYINTTGRFAGLLYYIIEKRWGGNKIRIISLELWEYEDKEEFYNKHEDVTKQVYDEMMCEYPEERWC